MQIEHITKPLNKYLIFLLILALPLTHKESFSIFDPDLVWSKFLLGPVAVLGVWEIIKDFKNYKNDLLWMLIVAMLFFQVASLAYSQDIVSSLRMILFTSAIVFSYPTLKSWANSDSQAFIKSANLYGIALFFTFVFLLCQVFLQEKFQVAIGGVWPVPDYPTRYGSTFWDVNHYGAYVSSIILLSLSLLIKTFKSNNVLNNLKWFFIVLIGIYCLYMTGSRSASIGFFTGLMAIFLVSVFKKESMLKSANFKSILNLFTLATIMLVPLVLIYTFKSQIHEAFLYRSSSFFSHLFLIKVGINVGLENYLTGVGANAFHAYFRDSQWAASYYYIDQAALDLKLPLHNLWLEVFAETGVVSFLFFALFWILLITGLYKVYLINNDFLGIGFMAGIISYLTGGLMYSYKSEFFWIFVLLSVAYVSINLQLGSATASMWQQLKNISSVYKGKLLVLSVVLYIAVTIYPVFFILQPISPSDLAAYESGYGNNVFNLLVNTFRYVFGNYSFVAHIIPLYFRIFVSGLALILMSLIFKGRSAFVFAGILLGVISILNLGIGLGTFWYYLLIGLFVLTVIAVTVYQFIKPTEFSINRETFIIMLFAHFILLSMLVSFAGLKSDERFNKDLVFLLELAYNRSFMEDADIWLGEGIDDNLVNFYCSKVKFTNGSYNISNCRLKELSDFEGVPVNRKSMAIVKLTDGESLISGIHESVSESEGRIGITELELGEYKLILTEPNRISN